MDRSFKATYNHWRVVLDYFECYPEMVKNKFENVDGDKSEMKNKWAKLTTQLNSLGHGQKSEREWQLAIGRWRSKVKSKAAEIRREINGTGGGPVKTTPLTDIEERLMAIVGWKTVDGDGNIELGMTSNTRGENTRENINHNSASPPPLIYSNSNTTPNRSDIKQITQKKRKIPQTTEKTKRFVSLNNMHKETINKLSNIDKNLEKLANAVVECANIMKSNKANV